MRQSQMLIPTLKENPADADVISHRLMLRAGLIRQVASGLYTWLPLGLRVLRRVEQILREELARSGAQEVLMPVVQPVALAACSTSCARKPLYLIFSFTIFNELCPFQNSIV